MTLGTDLTEALPELRAAAESRMTQTWRIGTLSETTDPATFDVVKTVQPVVYTGRGRLKPSTTAGTNADAAGQLVAIYSLELHLPVGTTGIERGMVAICDACPEDPSLVGRMVRIAGGPSQGQVTAARYPVDDSTESI